MATTAAAHISLPTPLLAAYRAAGGPPLSGLVRDAVEAWLRERGVPVPPEPAPTRTAAATAARWRKPVGAPCCAQEHEAPHEACHECGGREECPVCGGGDAPDPDCGDCQGTGRCLACDPDGSGDG